MCSNNSIHLQLMLVIASFLSNFSHVFASLSLLFSFWENFHLDFALMRLDPTILMSCSGGGSSLIMSAGTDANIPSCHAKIHSPLCFSGHVIPVTLAPWQSSKAGPGQTVISGHKFDENVPWKHQWVDHESRTGSAGRGEPPADS